MKILALHTDIIECAGILPENASLSECTDTSGFEGFVVADDSAAGIPNVFASAGTIGKFEHIIVEKMAAESQLDRLKSCSSKYPVLAMALDGRGFHGQHGRPWMTGIGNLYLSIYLPAVDLGRIRLDKDAPDLYKVGDYLSDLETNDLFASADVYTRLQMMPCMAVYKALKKMGISPALRYPNDIIIYIDNQPHKIAGCLTEISVRGDTILSVRFGIGLNVGFAPDVYGTGLHTTCVCRFVPDATVGRCCRMVCEEIELRTKL